MKMSATKMITLIAVCMMASVIPALAEPPNGSTGNGTSEIKNLGERMTPEERITKIDERIKKLEEHKSRANSNGKTDIANAIQGMIDALNNLKGVIGTKNKDSIKSAIEQVKTARAALEKIAPPNAKENCSKTGGNKTNKTQGKNSL